MVALTGMDEENIIMSLYAKMKGVSKVVAKINNNTVGTGISKSKKDAEMIAAKMALELFGVNI